MSNYAIIILYIIVLGLIGGLTLSYAYIRFTNYIIDKRSQKEKIMKTKFYSDVTNEYYDTARACLDAEAKAKAKEEENRKKFDEIKRAQAKAAEEEERKEVKRNLDKARVELKKAQDAYDEALTAYWKSFPRGDVINALFNELKEVSKMFEDDEEEEEDE